MYLWRSSSPTPLLKQVPYSRLHEWIQSCERTLPEPKTQLREAARTDGSFSRYYWPGVFKNQISHSESISTANYSRLHIGDVVTTVFSPHNPTTPGLSAAMGAVPCPALPQLLGASRKTKKVPDRIYLTGLLLSSAQGASLTRGSASSPPGAGRPRAALFPRRRRGAARLHPATGAPLGDGREGAPARCCQAPAPHGPPRRVLWGSAGSGKAPSYFCEDAVRFLDGKIS